MESGFTINFPRGDGTITPFHFGFTDGREHLFRTKLDSLFHAATVLCSGEKILERVAELEASFAGSRQLRDALAMLSFAGGNLWASAATLVERLRLEPSEAMRGHLDHCRDGLGAVVRPWYELLVHEGREALSERLLADFTVAFEGRAFDDADRALQVLNALRWPYVSPLPELADLRRLGADAQAARQLPRQMDFSAPFNSGYDTSDDPNRQGLAALVAGLVEAETPVCLEIGCYAAAQLRAVGAALARRDRQPALYGVEPNRAAVAHVGAHYPDIAVVAGGIDDLDGISAAGWLPDGFDVVVVSGVCEMLEIAEMNALLGWTRPRAKLLAIAGEIMNFDGSYPLTRGACRLHPFGRLLRENGWRVVDLLAMPEPGRNYSGYLVAAPAA